MHIFIETHIFNIDMCTQRFILYLFVNLGRKWISGSDMSQQARGVSHGCFRSRLDLFSKYFSRSSNPAVMNSMEGYYKLAVHL